MKVEEAIKFIATQRDILYVSGQFITIDTENKVTVLDLDEADVKTVMEGIWDKGLVDKSIGTLQNSEYFGDKVVRYIITNRESNNTDEIFFRHNSEKCSLALRVSDKGF